MGLNNNQYSLLKENSNNDDNNIIQAPINNYNNTEILIDTKQLQLQQQQQQQQQFIRNEIKIERINSKDYKKVTYGFSTQLPLQLSKQLNENEYKSIIESINQVYELNSSLDGPAKYLFQIFIIFTILSIGGFIALVLTINNMFIFMGFGFSFIFISSLLLLLNIILSNKNSKKCESNIKDQIKLINNNLYNRGIMFKYYRKSHYDCYKTTTDHLNISFPVSIQGFNVLVQPLPLLNHQESIPTYISIEKQQQKQQMSTYITPLNKSNYKLYN